jgi:photosystem II stability/assembly factor-like uncharacterized protein
MGFFSRFVCVAALAALTLLSGATAGVNTPHSGWYSGNPLLGPNTLTDMACSGSTCYASGEFGTLLKSTDGGSTWAGIVTGLTHNLNRVRLASGSPDRLVVGSGCALRRSDDGGDTFSRLPFTATDTGCSTGAVSFSFPTSSTGYLLLSDTRVLATQDGGRSFSRRTAVPGGANDLLCTGERTCFTAGLAGQIQRTADGGVSWAPVGGLGGQVLNGLEQVDEHTLYAVGTNRTLLKSTDGGATWIRKAVNNLPVSHFRSIRCGTPLHCLITVETSSMIVRTTDGGETFSTVVPSSDPTLAVEFAGASRALAAGVAGSAEVSNDAGSTWTPVGHRIQGNFHVLAAVSNAVAYAGGEQGVLARTTDGGQTWVNVSPPSERTITGLAGAGDRLYVLAADHTLQRSDNGGQSYQLLNPGTGPVAAIHAVDADRLLLVGFRGVVRSPDAGETFAQVSDRDVRGVPLTGVDRAGSATIVFAPNRAAVSADGGTSWTRIRLPQRRLIRDLDFVTGRLGFLLDTGGALWRTPNAGRTWEELPSLATNDAYSLEFSDATSGYLAVRWFGTLRGFGLVLRTADGGRSWHPQLVSRQMITAVRTGGQTDYALAGGSHLLATVMRGDVGSRQGLTLSARPRVVNRGGRVVVSGRLSPADGREEVVVARLSGGRWTVQRAIAASNGAFTTRWRLSGRSYFVAQVLGDADHVGAGTAAVMVSVRPPKKRR